MTDAESPGEISADERTAPFLRVLRYVGEHARTDEQRDRVMSALYDVFVGVGDDDGDPSATG